MNPKLNTLVFTLMLLSFTVIVYAKPFYSMERNNPDKWVHDSAEIQYPGKSQKSHIPFPPKAGWTLPETGNLFPRSGALRNEAFGNKKPAAFIFSLSANEGGSSAPGISGDLRIIPNAGVQVIWNNFGMGLDAGMFSSSPDFSFSNYYKQFDSHGFAVFKSTRDKWKSSYFSIGPQYTLHLAAGGGTSAAQSLNGSAIKGGATQKELDITFSLKAGISINKSPDIRIYDSTAPYKVIASYTAPDTYKKNVMNIKPGLSLTYWFNDHFGANVNAQYLIVTGQNEFETGYRDVSKVDFTLNQKEVQYLVLRSPVITTTTKGPGHMFSMGAGITVKLGRKEQTGKASQTNPTSKPDLNKGEQAGKPVSKEGLPNVSNKPAEPFQEKEVKQDQQKEKEREYIRPSILSPANGSSISSGELKKGILLKWTSVEPPPSAPVIYHVKVYEVVEGQNAIQIIKTSKPVFEKEVEMSTLTAFSPASPTNKNGTPNQLAWTVQATDRSGKPYGINNGTSEPSTFKVNENDIDIAIDSLKVECCKDGKQLIKITIKNNLANTNTILRKIIITAVNGNFGSPQPIDISALVSPPLPFSFMPSSASASLGRLNFTALVDCNLNMNNLVIKAEADRTTNMGLVTDNDLETDTLHCICRECDNIQIEIPDKAQTSYSATTVSLISPVSVSPKKVKKVTADIAYFSYTPESGDCAPCDKDSKTFGNFITASLTAPGFPSAALIPYGHEAIWNSNSSAGSLLNGQFSFNVSVPPLVKCCSAKIRFCIRYTFQFDDCTVCEKVVCYTINKEGCTK